MAIDAAAPGHGPATASAVSRWLRPHRPVAAWVPVFAGLSPTLLTIAWLIGDAVQPTSYSPMRQTVSVLAGRAGTDRWIVTGAVYMLGACHFATAAGLRVLPLRARVGLVVAGLAAIGIAASPQPASGSRAQHLVFTSIGAVAITVWPALAAQRRAPASILVSARISAVVSLGFLILLSWTVVETQVGGSLGLAERVSSAIQTGWPVAVAVSLRRTKRSDPDSRGRRERGGAN
ncbi:MAG: hypothetical protein QOK11_1406 [Pseudonocardiales bacterium]|nr:hypothetical protein [Pseudonocardiales bacterium]